MTVTLFRDDRIGTKASNSTSNHICNSGESARADGTPDRIFMVGVRFPCESNYFTYYESHVILCLSGLSAAVLDKLIWWADN